MSFEIPEPYLPLNNLDLLDERGELDPYADLLDDLPYEPTLDEVYGDASEDALEAMTRNAFYDGMNSYRRNLPQHKSVERMPLTPDQKLVLGAGNFVAHYVVTKYGMPCPEVSLMDRVQNASLYVTKAADKFDDRGNNFIGFFQPWLNTAIKCAEQCGYDVIYQGDIIRVPEKNPGYYRVKNLIRRMSVRYGYQMDPEDALEFNVELEDEALQEYREIHVEHIPIEEAEEVENIVDDDPAVNPEIRQVSLASVKAVLKLLDKRQKRVIAATISQRQIASQIAAEQGITRQAINHVRQTSYARLQKISGLRELLYSE